METKEEMVLKEGVIKDNGEICLPKVFNVMDKYAKQEGIVFADFLFLNYEICEFGWKDAMDEVYNTKELYSLYLQSKEK